MEEMNDICARCQFLYIQKDQEYSFNSKTYTYDVKAISPKFICDFDKRHITIGNPNSFCCDKFLIKDEEEFANVLELMKKFEIKGW